MTQKQQKSRENQPLACLPPATSAGETFGTGEVWYADLGSHTGTSIQGGVRPVMILSNDIANENADTVTIVPITSKFKKPYLPTHVTISAGFCNGLVKSMILCEQITTLSKVVLRSYIGRLPDEKITEVAEAVQTQLAI